MVVRLGPTARWHLHFSPAAAALRQAADLAMTRFAPISRGGESDEPTSSLGLLSATSRRLPEKSSDRSQRIYRVLFVYDPGLGVNAPD